MAKPLQLSSFNTQLPAYSSTNSAVIAGTNTQGQAPLVHDFNLITTAGSAPSGVTLPAAYNGRAVIILNKGANPVNIYPALGGQIDSLARNISIQIPVGGWMEFNASSTTQWYSTQGIFAAPNYSTNAAVAGGTNAQGQGPLTADFNVITNSGSGGVTLPIATTGRKIVIVNRGIIPVNIYPASGAQIDLLGANNSIQIPVGGWMEFNASSTTQWYSTQGIFAAPNYSTNAAVTAGTNTQGQAPLVHDFNLITAAANAPSGVTLPTATVGRKIIISNRGANAANVFPASGAQIDSLAANASIQVPSLGIIELNASSATQWYSRNTLMYAGTTKIAGQFDIGTTAPTNTNRLNYDGNLYATNFIGSGTITSLKETRVALGSGAIDLSLGNYFSRTLTGTTTFSVSNVPATGTSICIILDLTNGGSFTVNWWAGIKWPLGVAPTLTATGRDVLGFFTHDGGTNWSGFLLGRDVK